MGVKGFVIEVGPGTVNRWLRLTSSNKRGYEFVTDVQEATVFSRIAEADKMFNMIQSRLKPVIVELQDDVLQREGGRCPVTWQSDRWRRLYQDFRSDKHDTE